MVVLKIIGIVFLWLLGLCVMGVVFDAARDFLGLPGRKPRRLDDKFRDK